MAGTQCNAESSPACATGIECLTHPAAAVCIVDYVCVRTAGLPPVLLRSTTDAYGLTVCVVLQILAKCVAVLAECDGGVFAVLQAVGCCCSW